MCLVNNSRKPKWWEPIAIIGLVFGMILFLGSVTTAEMGEYFFGFPEWLRSPIFPLLLVGSSTFLLLWDVIFPEE